MSQSYQATPSEYDTDGSLEDEVESGDERSRRLSVSLPVMICLGVAALLALFASVITYLSPGSVETVADNRQLSAEPLPIGAPKCDLTNGPFQFNRVSNADPAARKALTNLLTQTKEILLECEPPVSINIADLADSLVHGTSKAHTASYAYKYATDCSSITYLIKIIPAAGTGWMGQINYDMSAHVWQVLNDGFQPQACDISMTAAAGPRREDAGDDPDIVEAAKFAVAQLNHLRTVGGCADGTNLTFNRVNQASEQLTRYKKIMAEIIIDASFPNIQPGEEVLACATIFINFAENPPPFTLETGFDGKGNFSACSDLNTWSEAAWTNDPNASELRKLYGVSKQEDQASDPTQRLTVFRRHHFGPPGETAMERKRRLQSAVKPPITMRYIWGYNVPGDYDFRLDPTTASCLNDYPVYDQGSCGCCYGAAMAQVFGMRKCILDQRKATATAMSAGGRRLNKADEESLRGRRMQSWDGNNTAEPGCEDDLSWRDPNNRDCNWYAGDVSRCVSRGEVGQRTYCKKTCHTCPNSVDYNSPPASMANYLYATQDIATCSCNSATAGDTDVNTNCKAYAGCDGGSMYAVWDTWMRLTSRLLRQRDCDPLKIRCLDHGGVTNPINSNQCSAYENTPTWSKPCNCVPSEEIPSHLPECGRTEDACTTLAQPTMIYQIMTSTQGLTLAETVLNFQRHVMEEGPIYVTMMVTSEFSNFYKSGQPGMQGDVLNSDGGTQIGGHALLLTGWGTTTEQNPCGVGSGVTYWWLRNSWSQAWGLGGHAKVRAGANLYQLESRAAAAMMAPASEIKDYSPPVCQTTAWATSYKHIGTQLCYLELHTYIECSEDATFNVSYSRASSSLAEPSSGEQQVFTSQDFRCPAGQQCVISGFDLLYAGYGTQAAQLYMKVKAWDQNTNYYSTHTNVQIEPVDGMDSARAASACGAPDLNCVEGCVIPVFEQPNNHVDPAPPPAWEMTDTGATLPPVPSPPGSQDGTSRRRNSLTQWLMPSSDERATGDAGKKTCFPPDSAVSLADGQRKFAHALEPGDSLQGAQSATSFLQDFHEGHGDKRKDLWVRYLQIVHEFQRPGRPLLISAGHLIHRVDNGSNKLFVPAADLQVGDVILASVKGSPKASGILNISNVQRKGYAAPLTSSGDLWVEDVLVSSYSLLTDEQFKLWQTGPSILREYTQQICHVLAAPFRALVLLRQAASAVFPSWRATSASTTNQFAAISMDAYLSGLSIVFDGMSRLLVKA